MQDKENSEEVQTWTGYNSRSRAGADFINREKKHNEVHKQEAEQEWRARTRKGQIS